MNLLDVGLIVVLAACVAWGLWRGFVRITLGVAGFGFGLAAALRLSERGPSVLPSLSPAAASGVVFAVVFLTSLFVTGVVIFVVGQTVRAAGIGWMDRLAGAVIGFGGGLLIGLGILLGLATFLPRGSPLLRGSRALPVAVGAVDIAAILLPPALAERYQDQREALAEAAR